MEPKPVPNPNPEPETALTRRALDPFFETGDQRDHANQWDVTAVWPGAAAEPKKTEPTVKPQ